VFKAFLSVVVVVVQILAGSPFEMNAVLANIKGCLRLAVPFNLSLNVFSLKHQFFM
jgi:hypothetical protein